MRGAGHHGCTRVLRDGRLSVVAVLLATTVLLGASLEHIFHEHPHRTGQELSCVVCQTPIGAAPTMPAVAPPTVRPITALVTTPDAPPPPRAPLSFSPKQSPPSA